MSDLFEAPAEPTSPAVDASTEAIDPSGATSRIDAGAIDVPTNGAESSLLTDEPPPTPKKRAPRRTGSRTRKTEPTTEPAAVAEAPTEPAEAPPTPARRRRTRRPAASVEPVPEVAEAPLPILAETVETVATVVESADVDTALSTEQQHGADVDAHGPDIEAMASMEFASFELDAAQPVASIAEDELLVEAGPASGIVGEAEVVESEESDADGAAPKRRRSRRGSRGGRRGRGRRGTAEGEASGDEEGSVADVTEAGLPEAGSAVAAADETLPADAISPIETPLPDVMVHFRPVSRRRPPAPEAAGGAVADRETPDATEMTPREAPGEGEPASRGRRRRRRGERSERPSTSSTDREERLSGVGGALPPRVDRPEIGDEPPVERSNGSSLPAEVTPEAPAERPKVERAGRGQRGDRVLERAAARAEREAARTVDKDVDKGERLTKEIAINVSPRETRIAVLENGRLVELHVEREERVVGSVFKGKVANVLPGMDAAFVEIGLDRNAWLHVGDILFEGGDDSPHSHKRPRDLKIRDVAKPGQEILVQVVKGPRGTKGARVSTRMSLPGRYLVLMPESDNLGVSRKIEDPAERDRLKRIGDRLRPAGFGVIIRTEAEERTEEELKQDLDLLLQLWNQIQERSRQVKAPALVHQDLSLILKTIRDVFGADVDKLVLDSADDYKNVRDMLAILSPELIDRVQLYEEPEPIFSRYGLEDEIERLLKRKVWLRSGGYLIIDASEALTAIDVNTGKFVGSTSLSDTILKTNLDAVQEIARQLRLRDIGGMIVLDFIDMTSARDRAQVMAALDRALKKDRTRTKVAHISPLGLIEMTRKRTGETVTDLITQTCEYCQGRGRTLSPETLSIQIERAIRRRCAENEFEAVLVHAHPEVCAHLIGPEGENVEAIEHLVRRPIYIRARHEYHMEKFEVLPCEMMEVEKQLFPYRGGQVVECDVQKLELITAPRSAAWIDGYFVDLANGTRYQGSKIRVRLTDVRRSFALGEPVAPATALDKSEPI